MENFFLRAITDKRISAEVNNFIFYDFPKLQMPERWKAEYLSVLEKIMNEEQCGSGEKYFEHAKKEFVASFKTIIGKALAKIVLEHKDEAIEFSHLIFSTDELFKRVVDARNTTMNKVVNNKSERVDSFVEIFEMEMYKQIEKLFKQAQEYPTSLENVIQKVCEEIPAENPEIGMESVQNDENADSESKVLDEEKFEERSKLSFWDYL
ncbi:MAG: hypothetical protein J6J60_01510 [Clostridia bacterium]|nr:hypothetical protein [Clostridia bacterium]